MMRVMYLAKCSTLSNLNVTLIIVFHSRCDSAENVSGMNQKKSPLERWSSQCVLNLNLELNQTCSRTLWTSLSGVRRWGGTHSMIHDDDHELHWTTSKIEWDYRAIIEQHNHWEASLWFQNSFSVQYPWSDSRQVIRREEWFTSKWGLLRNVIFSNSCPAICWLFTFLVPLPVQFDRAELSRESWSPASMGCRLWTCSVMLSAKSFVSLETYSQ